MRPGLGRAALAAVLLVFCPPSRAASPRAADLVARARALSARGRLTAALAELDRAEELAPDDAVVRGARGSVLAAMGRCAEAEEERQAAVSLSTGDAKLEAIVQLGLEERDCSRDYAAAAWARQDIERQAPEGRDSALAKLDQAEERSPRDGAVRGERGRVLAGLGRCAEAEEEGKAAVSLSTGAAKLEALFQLGVDERDCGRAYAPAARAFESVGRQARRDGYGALGERARIALGLTDCLGAKYSDGEDELMPLRLVKPHAEGLAYALGVCRQGEGRLDEAVAFFDEAVDSSGPSAPFAREARFRRGQLERSRGEHAAAREDFAQACRQGYARACGAAP